MSAEPKVSRRGFLRMSLATGTGLMLGFRIPNGGQPAAEPDIRLMHRARQASAFKPNAYLQIAPDNTITIQVHRSELGQGVNTSIPMLIAEELEVDLADVHIQQSPADKAYGDQVTGGSVSISSSYRIVRLAGAAAKMMLITAAAQTWGVEAATCRAENCAVIHDASGKSLSYGELAAAAATLPVPKAPEITLKDPAQFKLIGKPLPLIDGPDIVTGKTIYASDVKLPGMLVAVVARCPVFYGKVVSYDDSAALAIPGVRNVVQISSGVAVAADDTWTALKGRDALQITWDEGKVANISTADMRQKILDKVKPQNDPNIVEAVYEMPYLAHVTLEPMTCVADVRAESCEIWAPTQDRQGAQRAARLASGVKSDQVIVHVPVVGGAFGRRLQSDYVTEAVEISKAVGAPIKTFWTREDDIQHDYYHPFQIVQVYGKIKPRTAPTVLPVGSGGGIPTGAWRSVENHPSAFYFESFLDEMAAATGEDPYETHLAAHAGTPREAVLKLAAEKAGWGAPLPEGWGRGIAVFSTFGVTHVAEVVEVSVENGKVRVHRVVCAVDCGTVVNPDTVKAQMEGGIIFGLSAALYGEIIIDKGRVQQSNYGNYPIMRMNETPQIEVYIVESDKSPTGVGEPPVPPAAPALMNAIYAATGKRIRRFPVSAETF